MQLAKYILCAVPLLQASLGFSGWKENCQSNYDPQDMTPIVAEVLTTLERSRRPDALVLEERLRTLLLTHARQFPPIWNSTDIQDTGRAVQEFLFQQKADPGLEPLRNHWLMLMLVQHQWDVMLPALKNRQGPLAVFQEAETRLGRGEFAAADKLFQVYRDSSKNLDAWLSFRLMETRFLLGNSDSSLDQMTQVLSSPLLEANGMRNNFTTFLQAFAGKGQNLKKLLALLQDKADEDSIGQVAFCVIKNSRNPEDRSLALDRILNFKNPGSQALRFVNVEVPRIIALPSTPDTLLNWQKLHINLARTRFASTLDAGVQADDAFDFIDAQRKIVTALLQSRSLLEKPGSAETLEQQINLALEALPPAFDRIELKKLRAQVLEKSKRPGDAAALYKELALNARSRQDQRAFAEAMLKNYSAAVANDESFLDACRVYQRLVPDGRQELSRCDLMLARQSMNSGNAGDARQRLWQIVYAFPASLEGQAAADRLLEASATDAHELFLTTEKLLNIRNFQTGFWGNKLKALRKQSSYQRIEHLSSIEDKAEAYFFFSQKEKGDPLAEKSLLMAAKIDQDSGRLGRAMDRLEIWLQDYPDSPEAPARILELVTMAEKALQIKRARHYIQWTEGRSWSNEQADLIKRKTCLFDTIENPLLALNSCKNVGDHQKEGPELRLQLARALAYKGYSNQLNIYAKDSLIPRDDFSIDQKIEILDLIRKADGITPARQDDIKTTMTNYYLEQTDSLGPESRRILGGLAYQAAQRTLPAFQALPIHGTRSDELIGAIQAKKQAFDELETLFNKVLQTRDPHWGSSALCDLGLAAENFSEALGRLPDIEGLDRKKLSSQMTSQIASWRAKAKSFAGSAAKTIEKFGTLHLDNRRIIQEAHRIKEDAIQFNDWIPSLTEAESTASQISLWSVWDEVAGTLLEESSWPQNAGQPTTLTMVRAVDFAIKKSDFIRAGWLNQRLLLSDSTHWQSLGFWNKGRMQARLDDYDGAEQSWLQSLRLDPSNLEVQKQLGMLYARFGFFAKALNQLKALENDVLVQITLVAMERQLDLNEQADKRCEALTVGTPRSEALYNCSLLEFQNHRNANKAIDWMAAAQNKANSGSPLVAAAQKQLSEMQIWKAKFQSTR